ncbi:MAG: TldD/PmbA family protein [Spirochaetales bacterium]|nr:TldD/PmbA family protein [Spirochaetales bacterium]
MVKVPYSEHLRRQRDSLREVVHLLRREYPYVSLLATDCRGLRYAVQRREASIQESRFGERGSVVRIHDGHGYIEFSFNEGGEPEALAAEICRNAAALARQRSALPGAARRYPLPEEEALTGRWQGEVGELPEQAGGEQVVRSLTELRDRAFTLSDCLVDMRVIYEGVRVSKLFLSAARELEQSYLWSQGYLIPVSRKGEVTRVNHASFSGLKGTELIDEMAAVLPEALQVAEQLLAAGKVEPGEYEVILSPKVAGLVAHESFGHGVELDMFVKGRARAAEYLGKPVGSSLVSLHDGARAAHEVASYWFDDEGTTGSDTLVIDRGVFRAGISDELSALALGLPPTGNGRRESFERKAYARMTNTFFSPGSDRLEQMIASIRHGYLLEEFSSGMEDPKNWGIQCVILFGREIRDGQLTGALVSPVIITGYVPEVLQAVSMVSGDFALSGSGMCGKGHKEYAKTSTGGPYIKTVLRLG